MSAAPLSARAAARNARRRVLMAGGGGDALAACDLLACVSGVGADAGAALLVPPGPLLAAFPGAIAPAERGPGQGLAEAVGRAIGARLVGRDARVVALLDPAEAVAGAVWEAAGLAAAQGLGGLVALVPGAGKAMAAPWKAFGWHAIEVDGHDTGAIAGALAEAARVGDRPAVVLARTTPGMGVSFMLDAPEWAARGPAGELLAAALAELGGEGEPPAGASGPASDAVTGAAAGAAGATTGATTGATAGATAGAAGDVAGAAPGAAPAIDAAVGLEIAVCVAAPMAVPAAVPAQATAAGLVLETGWRDASRPGLLAGLRAAGLRPRIGPGPWDGA